jgi:hypothetical protein
MNNSNQEIVSKLKFRRSRLEEEVGQHIAHIEELSVTIYKLEHRAPRANTFPPQNPFQDVPTRRIDTKTYIRLARTFITQPGSTQGIQRIPGAETPALIIELGQRIREVNRIISAADQEAERLAPRARTHKVAQRIQELQTDREKLAGELQFYKDLKEALENRRVRPSQEEIQEQRNRARDWADARLE